MATDDTCSSIARTSAKTRRSVERLKTLTGLAEVAKSKDLEEKPEVMIVISFNSLSSHRDTKSYFFAGTFN